MSAAPPPDSSLLVPYRAVGLICDGKPCVIVRHGRDTFLTAAVGRSFQVFNCAKLRQVFVGPTLDAAVGALAAHGEVTCVASGEAILLFKRAQQLATCDGVHQAPVRKLLTIGDLLLSLDASGLLAMWSLPDGEAVGEVHTGFVPTAIIHPATYLNKVCVGERGTEREVYTRCIIFLSSTAITSSRP